jgi:hypothetical protein
MRSSGDWRPTTKLFYSHKEHACMRIMNLLHHLEASNSFREASCIACGQQTCTLTLEHWEFLNVLAARNTRTCRLPLESLSTVGEREYDIPADRDIKLGQTQVRMENAAAVHEPSAVRKTSKDMARETPLNV